MLSFVLCAFCSCGSKNHLHRGTRQGPGALFSTRTDAPGVTDRLAGAGMVTAASVAAAAVNQAVSMSSLNAPDVSQSQVARAEGVVEIDEETGLPLAYDKDLIEKYWRSQGSSLQQRWSEFLSLSVPFLLRVATLLVQGGADELSANDASLARDAREICEKLGPTFVKLAQTLSVRPDVLPQAALDELAVLQDSVTPFETEVAVAQIIKELGIERLEDVFSSVSEEPVAAASLAQVYKGTLKESGDVVAIKVQRPNILETVSKDLYVLRRAVEVYQRLMDRFAPQQQVNYVDLLNEWAVGFYTELDFRSEMVHLNDLRKALVVDEETKCEGVYVPKSYDEFCTARLAVTEWIDGVKLSSCEPSQIRELTPVAQEAFLTQLLDVGLVHADPHAGNLLAMDDGRLALLDFGLVSRVRPGDRDVMVSALIHLANRDWAALVDDFIELEVLPKDANRPVVVPLMDKALSPYVAGGGAQKFQERVLENYGISQDDARASVGGFQAMTQDALSVLNDVPFSIPPYFALLGRAIVTLEGIALSGDPDYALIQEAYPFVSRKLLSSDRPALRDALRDALYGSGGAISENNKMNPKRLVGLVASAAATSAKNSDGTTAAYFDVDALADSVDAKEGVAAVLKYVLSDQGGALRDVIESEAVEAVDVLSRQAARRAFDRSLSALRPPVRNLPFFGSALDAALPDPSEAPIFTGTPSVPFVTPRKIVDAAAPALDRDDELYAFDLVRLGKTVLDDAVVDTLMMTSNEGPLAGGQGGQTNPIQTAADVTALLSASVQATQQLENNPLLQPIKQILDTVVSSSAGRRRSDLDEVLESLNEADRAALRQLTSRVFDRLSHRVADRLQHLIQPPSTSSSSPSVEEGTRQREVFSSRGGR